jgi:hypothetical protein
MAAPIVKICQARLSDCEQFNLGNRERTASVDALQMAFRQHQEEQDGKSQRSVGLSAQATRCPREEFSFRVSPK